MKDGDFPYGYVCEFTVVSDRCNNYIPWRIHVCCYIWCSMDPINIPHFYVSINIPWLLSLWIHGLVTGEFLELALMTSDSRLGCFSHLPISRYLAYCDFPSSFDRPLLPQDQTRPITPTWGRRNITRKSPGSNISQKIHGVYPWC